MTKHSKHSKQYFNKREYLGIKEIDYYLSYGEKTVIVTMKWISGEYRITEAIKIKSLTKWIKHDTSIRSFPYRRSVKTIDRIEEVLK